MERRGAAQRRQHAGAQRGGGGSSQGQENEQQAAKHVLLIAIIPLFLAWKQDCFSFLIEKADQEEEEEACWLKGLLV